MREYGDIAIEEKEDRAPRDAGLPVPLYFQWQSEDEIVVENGW